MNKTIMKMAGLLMVLALAVTSCKTHKQVAYFQDTDTINIVQTHQETPILIQNGDKLFIQVKAQGSEVINNMFSMSSGNGYSNVTSVQNSPYAYTVNEQGDIDFPVIGKLHVAGLTRSQVEAAVKNAILTSGQARDITVNVTYTNLEISVMGEVTNPGRFSIDRDEVTILDALSMARDLTIYGRRENVKVLRMENGHQHVYKVNLCDAKSLMSSPVYYLKQNDVVYVEPNKAKAQNSEIGSMTTLWFSATSIGVSLISLLVNILKK
ncbi:MAG: polysaccharide biosynthesis/export family protein [Prevotellaceae bacterium]|nr:polysaccharide biosynthesis/export family protein [Prevotellaceae bacterium]